MTDPPDPDHDPPGRGGHDRRDHRGWLVADGDPVTAGQPLYTLETEKVEMEVECPATGVVRLIGSVGQTYPVGEVVGQVEAI